MIPEDLGPLPDTHRWIARLLLLLIANLVLYIGVMLWIGGEAISGYAQSGYFFLGNHDKFTEVSHWVYIYSLVHTWITILSLPIIGLCGNAIGWYRVP